ncbi:MAG: hypothetical protein R2826_07240 [Thermoleophilia bacterium]
MAEVAEKAHPRVIVIPRQLEGYFFRRLSDVYAGRSDVDVIVDRRASRRSSDRPADIFRSSADRRHQSRREQTTWKLPDMPILQS